MGGCIFFVFKWFSFIKNDFSLLKWDKYCDWKKYNCDYCELRWNCEYIFFYIYKRVKFYVC